MVVLFSTEFLESFEQHYYCYYYYYFLLSSTYYCCRRRRRCYKKRRNPGFYSHFNAVRSFCGDIYSIIIIRAPATFVRLLDAYGNYTPYHNLNDNYYSYLPIYIHSYAVYYIAKYLEKKKICNCSSSFG